MKGVTRTLVGRVALVQVIVTLIVLLVVIVLVRGAMTRLLLQDWDVELQGATSNLIRELHDHSDPQLHLAWLEREMEEQRPAGGRMEVRDEAGHLLVGVGVGPALLVSGRADACANQKGWRVCAQRDGHVNVLAGRSKAAGYATRNRFLMVTLGVALTVTFLLSMLARSITGRALVPLSQMAGRIVSLRPGAGDRVDLALEFAELRILGAAFDDLLNRVDEALARERRLAAEASHELRTPLTILRGEIEAMAQGPIEPGALDRVRASVDGVVALVDALLWFSRAQVPFRREDLAVVNLADLVREQVEALEGRFPETVILVDAPDEILVAAEERLLARAFANILENALKYSPPGRPVRVRLDSSTDKACLQVADLGPGIPAQAQGRVFDPFFRGPEERANSRGFGLGLPLSRAVARAHGGDLVLFPQQGDGSVFELSLPILRAPMVPVKDLS